MMLLGEIKIKSGEVILIDPSYDYDECGVVVPGAKNGIWNVYISEEYDEDCKSEVITGLHIVYKDLDITTESDKDISIDANYLNQEEFELFKKNDLFDEGQLYYYDELINNGDSSVHVHSGIAGIFDTSSYICDNYPVCNEEDSYKSMSNLFNLCVEIIDFIRGPDIVASKELEWFKYGDGAILNCQNSLYPVYISVLNYEVVGIKLDVALY